MDVKKAAAELEVHPKKLRQFLRTDKKYKSPGAGGRYDLSGFDIEELRNAYEVWAKVTTPRTALSEPETDDDEQEHEEIPALRLGASPDEVRRHAAQRVERLENMLRARGLHLSQMKSHPTWENVTKPKKQR